MRVRYFDSHCHLDPDAYGDAAAVDAVVARAREAGVARMLTVGAGYGEGSLRRALSVAERHPDVWAAVGIHPHDASHWDREVEAELRDALQHPRVVALGEIGLDFHYDNSPREAQRAALRAQIRIALALGRPVVVHDRSSEGETLRILEEEDAFSAPAVLYHCFTGSAGEMRAIVARGGHVSIPGIVTFKSADAMREVARTTPLDRLLIETDSPFLTPAPFRGTRNEPMRVPLVAAAVARERGLAVEELAEATWRTASSLFGIPV